MTRFRMRGAGEARRAAARRRIVAQQRARSEGRYARVRGEEGGAEARRANRLARLRQIVAQRRATEGVFGAGTPTSRGRAARIARLRRLAAQRRAEAVGRYADGRDEGEEDDEEAKKEARRRWRMARLRRMASKRRAAARYASRYARRRRLAEGGNDYEAFEGAGYDGLGEAGFGEGEFQFDGDADGFGDIGGGFGNSGVDTILEHPGNDTIPPFDSGLSEVGGHFGGGAFSNTEAEGIAEEAIQEFERAESVLARRLNTRSARSLYLSIKRAKRAAQAFARKRRVSRRQTHALRAATAKLRPYLQGRVRVASNQDIRQLVEAFTQIARG